MGTMAIAMLTVKHWWARQTGPIEARLLHQVNKEINDPEWWTRQPNARYVHPSRCHAWSPKIQAVCEIAMGDPDWHARHLSIIEQWGLARHAVSGASCARTL